MATSTVEQVLDLLNGLQRGDDHRPVVHVGNRHAVNQVVVAANRSPGDGDHRRARLILHAHKPGVAHGEHLTNALRRSSSGNTRRSCSYCPAPCLGASVAATPTDLHQRRAWLRILATTCLESKW